MGACTSRPKDLDHPQEQLPGENPSDDLHEPLVTKPDEASAETTTAQENNNVIDATSESQKVVNKPLVDLSEPTEPTTKTDGSVSDESSNPVAELVAVVDADSNKLDDGAQLSHNVDHQTTVITSDKKENHIDNVVVVAASETNKEEVDDEKQDGKTKEAALEKSESTGETEKSST